MATPREIPQRELRNRISEVLREVEAGVELRITVHGRPVADLVPIRERRTFVPFREIAQALAETPVDLAGDDRADRMARDLAAETGESLTMAVTVAVLERLERLRGAVPRERRADALSKIAERSAGRRVRDARSADEILGYGADGLPS